jgi:protein ImuB
MPKASHIPEFSVLWVTPQDQQSPHQGELRFHDRPFKLYEQAEPIMVIYATPEGVPRQFWWRGSQHVITRVMRGSFRIREIFNDQSRIS